METNREQCRVVGSVSNWQTWCREVEKEDLPCNWVELRVDAMPPELTAEEIMDVLPRVGVLLTPRHQSEGGLREWKDEERLRLTMELLPMAIAVDWEAALLPQAQELVQAAKAQEVTVIASHHDFEKTPTVEAMLEIEAAARAAGADIVKFAFRVTSMDEVMVGVELLQRATGPMAVMGMDAMFGPFSRILYAEHGSCLIYGYLGDTPTAPGQWSAERFYRALHR
ncbi:MAG: type I 3-dehydroquinate dehydratase [Akkermansia sp.]|nr:type I 3-dehydroquinate dehydratase [Akkermansia sp.]MBR3695788.1 type I 3-dehydroquinate dehydratase [Akkermansia sp.]